MKTRYLRITVSPLQVIVPDKVPAALRKFVGKSKTSHQRVRLWIAQDGKCFYCRCACILLEPKKRRGELPDNAATLEHLLSRFNPERRQPARGEIRHVMACYRCNSEHARNEQAARPLELQHRDSNKHREFPGMQP